MGDTIATSTERLPALPSEITPEWLGSKLGHKVKVMTMTRTIYGTASKLFFTIDYAEEVADPKSRPAHVCIKGVFDPTMVAAQPWTVSLAQREADFFARIAPTIKHMGYPKGWWGGKSDSQGIAIMSDLEYEGCKFPPEVASYPVEAVMDGTAQMAGLHAQFWGKTQQDYPWIWNNYDPAMTFMVRRWDDVVRESGRPKLPDYLMDGTRVNAALDRYFEERNPRFRTLLHGDTHLGNVYFTGEGGTRFLDWSAFHFGSCFHDLVYFVTAMLTIEDRRVHEMAILDHYLETLHRLGGPRFDRHTDKELMVEYKRSFLTNVIWTVCPRGIQSEERVAALCERTVSTWVDHKVIETIEGQPLPPLNGVKP